MQMKTCKIENCNNPVWSQGLCINHKPRKAIQKRKHSRKSDDSMQMLNLFFTIFAKRPHNSEVSGEYLGNEPLSVFFHHILPKNKYPEAKFDEENVILLTLDEHTNVESDPQRYEIINTRREYLKIKYNL